MHSKLAFRALHATCLSRKDNLGSILGKSAPKGELFYCLILTCLSVPSSLHKIILEVTFNALCKKEFYANMGLAVKDLVDLQVPENLLHKRDTESTDLKCTNVKCNKSEEVLTLKVIE